MRLSDCLFLLAIGTPMAMGQSCPTPATGTICNLSYDPVSCDGCSYENLCLAEAAGQTATSCTSACAEPDPNIVCTTEFAPVACGGYTWCIYDNLCTALAAGKAEADCQRSCPEVPEVACTFGTCQTNDTALLLML